MSYQIIGDSCTDLTKEQKESGEYKLVPLTLEIGADTFVDDENFNQSLFIEKMKAYPDSPKSACPAPEAYMDLFDKADDIYVVTLSSQLSGSYNSAEVARQMYLEQETKNIAIIDSKSASVGQTLLAMKIKELAEVGLPFEKVVEEVCKFRDEQDTMFVLEDLENLRKNGRLSNIKALLANVLNIKPVMGATPEGTIIQLDQTRGMKKALVKMAELAAEKAIRPEKKILGVAHCNNYELATFVRDEIMKRAGFKDSIIVDTAGVSTLYANDGGIIISF
ncbi:DegV family protein [Acetivibrio ethanolgignens]|uniref:Dihydroxyacetone kinase n=1 Tax=Acetivibrio ethanolgignens TaxID=290052 RepID=A0A0V8QAJ1_9FIRM|nr:DegV family protein [Acetivibrio ethanolgignens]KSV57605.1 dihydroxyacetone kinase [Acetivibrio ethanolgignens]